MFEKEIYKLTKEPGRDVSELKGLSVKNVIVAFPLVLLLFFCLFFYVMVAAVVKSDKDYLLKEDGVHVEAVVQSNEGTSENYSCSRLAYDFVAENGLKYSGTSNAAKNSSTCKLQKGDPVTVVYLPKNPTVNDIASRIRGNQPPLSLFIIFPLFFVFMFSPTIIPELKRILKHRRLYKYGSWAEGKLIYIKDGKDSFFPGVMMAPGKLYFEFNSSDGRSVESVTDLKNRWLLGQLKPGETLNVIYDPEKPENALVIECYIR